MSNRLNLDIKRRPRKVIGTIESGRVTLGDPPTFVQIPESFYQLHIAEAFRPTPFCDSTNESFFPQMSYHSRISENMSQIPQKESENVTKWQRLNNREHSPAPLSERRQLCDALLPKGKVKRPPPCNEGVAVRNMELGTTDGMSTCTLGPLCNDVCKSCKFSGPPSPEDI